MSKDELQNIEQEEMLEQEDDILQGLLKAAETIKRETRTIEIIRNGELLFKFKITGLSEEEYAEARERATTYTRNKKLGGLKLPEDTDTTEYRSWLIYFATVPEDRRRIWDNKSAWKALNVLSGPQLIDKVLLAGEKDKIVELIDELSGYTTDMEEVAKN